MINIKVKLLGNANAPIYKTDFSAGLDLEASIDKPLVIESNSSVLVPTGICIELPNEIEGQVRSRSGLALKHNIVVLNSPGTIDSDYRGEIKVILFNFSKESFIIEPSMRIAQIVFAKYEKVTFEAVDEILDTSRSDKGFGSTGLM